MNRSKIIEMLKDLQKIMCNKCDKIDYEDCANCNVHILINSILEELNGK